jgi:hypothetical protein
MENNVTRTRVEVKYLVPESLVEHVVAKLPAVRASAHGVLTVYFDRMDRSLSIGALRRPDHCTKVRVREYLDGSPHLWIEVKTRSGAWTRKWRYRLDKASLGPLLRSGELKDLPAAGSPCGTCALEAAEAFGRLREVAGGRLVAVGAVTAGRTAFRLPDLPFRFTLDRNIAYYRVPAGLYETRNSARPADLGVPVRRESCAVLELRHGGTVPEWCRDVVAGLERTEYSKFRTLVRAVDQSCKAGRSTGKAPAARPRSRPA